MSDRWADKKALGGPLTEKKLYYKNADGDANIITMPIASYVNADRQSDNIIGLFEFK